MKEEGGGKGKEKAVEEAVEGQGRGSEKRRWEGRGKAVKGQGKAVEEALENQGQALEEAVQEGLQQEGCNNTVRWWL